MHREISICLQQHHLTHKNQCRHGHTDQLSAYHIQLFTKYLLYAAKCTNNPKEYVIYTNNSKCQMVGRQRQVWFIPLADVCRVCR